MRPSSSNTPRGKLGFLIKVRDPIQGVIYLQDIGNLPYLSVVMWSRSVLNRMFHNTTRKFTQGSGDHIHNPLTTTVCTITPVDRGDIHTHHPKKRRVVTSWWLSSCRSELPFRLKKDRSFTPLVAGSLEGVPLTEFQLVQFSDPISMRS